MLIYFFNPDQTREIKDFDSSGAFIYPIVELNVGTVIHQIQFGPHSTIGEHQAVGSQIFFIIEGHGWVRGDEPEPVYVSRGDMVYWEAGEWHESGTDDGMIVIVIESQIPNPYVFRSHVK